MTLECCAFTPNRCLVIGHNSITKLKIYVVSPFEPSGLMCELLGA